MFTQRTARYNSTEADPLEHASDAKDLAEPFLRYHEPVDWQDNPLAKRESEGATRGAVRGKKHKRGNSLFEADWASVDDVA